MTDPARQVELELVERALESSGAAIAISEPTLELTYVNGAFLRLWGYERREEVLGRLAGEFWTDPAQADTAVAELSRCGAWAGEMVAKRADGSSFVARVTANLFGGEPGTPSRLVATFIDITALREAEAALRQSQKMEAVGLLAGGIAHDFNNLLTVILSGAEFLEEALGPGDPRRADAEQILAAARRAESLTRQLLAFSRRQVVRPGLLDVNGVVHGMFKMLRRLIGEDIELSLALAPAPLHVLADGALLEQALMNLVVNARDAMPSGGRLSLATSLRQLRGAEAARLDVRPGPYVALVVSDTGRGMDEGTLGRIFEPFFTTKPAGQGTGLGLSTVYGIARQGEGAVDVSSRPGAGSAFTLLLPSRPAPASAQASAERPAVTPVPPRAPLILVAEDEPSVRAVAERCLVQRGYRVAAAPDGEAALRLARELKAIDLLLTDVVMPGMNGRQLAEALRRVHPETPVLFMTGYTDDTALRLGIETHQVRILSKPFTPDGLAAAVEEAMGRPAAAAGGRVKTSE
ncbi:MAG TPA: response regulator [Anaeromyxobacteraceae bacterium]|nr:response regulator [Anaeromyxobacteraceae bacterium]